MQEMDLYGEKSSEDYCNIEDLDPETREDVEIALYGMLHHASNEEDYTVNTETNFNPYQSCSSQPLPETASISHSLEASLPTIPEDVDKTDLFCSLRSGEDTRRATKPSPKKSFSAKNSDSRQQLSLKRNPYSQYLIIEGNSKSSSLKKKKICDVITLSDEEDSKYASINKSKAKIKTTKFHSTILKNDESSSQSQSSSFSSTLDDSESDNSIIFLDPKPRTSSPSYDSLSDSSDYDLEVLKSSKLSCTNVNLKLNVSRPDDIDSPLVTCTNPTGSKSNWEQYCSTKWTAEMIQFYDKRDQGPSVDAIVKSFPKNAKWFLDDEDRQGSSFQKNRYFGKKAKMRCMNCNQWDHLTKNCREPRKICGCSICGQPGHKSFGCPKKVCLGCGRPSKILIECCPECRRESNVVCMICRSKHVTQRCPDLWRRYHSTTDKDDKLHDTGIALKPNHLLFCCNCAGRGHLVHDCPEKRWSKYTPVNPKIVSYENPHHFLKTVTNNGKSAVVISEDRKEVWVVGHSRDKSPKKAENLSYSFSLNQFTSAHAMIAARNSVLQEVKNVNIYWRKQRQKGLVLVEFTGNGDTKEAKIRFKKMIPFQKKSDAEPGQRKNLTQGNSVPKDDTYKTAAKTHVSNSISKVFIQHTNPNGRQMRKQVRVNLTEKQKRNVGKLLGKLESKYRVQITSCCMGEKWELMIQKHENGNSIGALNSIVKHLDATSTRPAGA